MYTNVDQKKSWVRIYLNHAKKQMSIIRVPPPSKVKRTWNYGNYMEIDVGVSKNNGTPKSSILIGFSIINHPFGGTPILGNTHVLFHPFFSWFCWLIQFVWILNLYVLQWVFLVPLVNYHFVYGCLLDSFFKPSIWNSISKLWLLKHLVDLTQFLHPSFGDDFRFPLQTNIKKRPFLGMFVSKISIRTHLLFRTKNLSESQASRL